MQRLSPQLWSHTGLGLHLSSVINPGQVFNLSEQYFCHLQTNGENNGATLFRVAVRITSDNTCCGLSTSI